jgi:hypothetical protein
MRAPVRPVTVHSFVSAPREEIFDFVADLASHVAFTDHYLKEFRLARARSNGLGAAARFLIDAPVGSQWAEFAVVEHDRPRRLTLEGHVGRLGRTSAWAVYDFTREAPELTRIDLTAWSEPATRLDALKESLGTRRWLRRQLKVSLERLRLIFEEPPAAPLARATVAGYEPEKAARFGA